MAGVTLDRVPIGKPVEIVAVAGERGFRRRLLELGLLPGTTVTVLRVAPLGDPLELVVRDTHLSIRQREAQQIEVSPRDAETSS
jgi:Fe2+ transport system protein FeoA